MSAQQNAETARTPATAFALATALTATPSVSGAPVIRISPAAGGTASANDLSRAHDATRTNVTRVPHETLEQIDQMAVEFHEVQDERFLATVRRLKEFFEIAHIHFNNASCIEGLDPFPTWAYEVLFVSKRLAIVDRSGTAGGLHPLDAPNNPALADCQPTPR